MRARSGPSPGRSSRTPGVPRLSRLVPDRGPRPAGPDRPTAEGRHVLHRRHPLREGDGLSEVRGGRRTSSTWRAASCAIWRRCREAESLWQGECFVFDERVAVGHGLADGHPQPVPGLPDAGQRRGAGVAALCRGRLPASAATTPGPRSSARPASGTGSTGGIAERAGHRPHRGDAGDNAEGSSSERPVASGSPSRLVELARDQIDQGVDGLLRRRRPRR